MEAVPRRVGSLESRALAQRRLWFGHVPQCQHRVTRDESGGSHHVISDELTRSEADRIFRALGDGTRRDILARTLVKEQSVSELARHYDLSFAAVQRHVAVLERAGLIAKRARGRERVACADRKMIRRASQLLRAYNGSS